LVDFTGKTVLVTGGARGVGRAIVRQLARHGAHVLVNYFHSREAAQETIAELRAAGAQASLIRGSVAKLEQVAAMFAQIREEHGYLDVLINNAASGALRPLAKLDERDWARTFDTNLKGSLWCAQQASRLMASRGGGTIVNLSSLGAGMVIDNYVAVGTSKAAVESLTRYLAIEFAPLNIRVNTASCGLVDGQVAARFPRAAELRDVVVAATPLGRLATEDDLARLVLFLASEESAWITGQTVVADGGLSLGNVLLSPPKRYDEARLSLVPQQLVAANSDTSASTGTHATPQTVAMTDKTVPEDPVPVDAGMGIAVVGMGLVVPGASDPEEFFRLLLQDEPVFSEPGTRWDLTNFFSAPNSKLEDSTYVRTSGYIHQIPEVGHQRISADYTTTWLRHALMQALEGVRRKDSDRHLFVVGYTADGSQHLEESLVWAGVTHRLAPRVNPADPAETDDRIQRCLAALRRHLRHVGDTPERYLPHVVGADAADGILPDDTELLMVDTACSSSLYALDIGMRGLRSGACDVAVCGGSFALGPRGSTLFSGLHGLSKSGDVRSFDRQADGVLFSDGAAVVVLKTLERARADGDLILGVLAVSALPPMAEARPSMPRTRTVKG
jgi:NAD(P)-dependent dehydrogenase (short-subunit alcohol dehydrogenase family)